MLTFVTMAMDIGKHSVEELSAVFRLLYASLIASQGEFRLYCYTNLPLRLFNLPNVVAIKCAEDALAPVYSNRWLNLSFHRHNLVARHIDKSPIWIDLDTVVCADLAALNCHSNFIVRYNLPVNRKLVFEEVVLSGREYFHGHFWRLDNLLHRRLQDTVASASTRPPHDLQDYFSLLYHRDPSGLVVANDVSPFILNWEWSFGHPTPDRIANAILFRDGRLIAADGRPFGILTFTFPSLLENLRARWNSVADPAARRFLQELSGIVET